MTTPSYQIECTAKSVIARDVVELKFKKPTGFAFRAGQFVLFDVPLIEKPDDIQTRAYSIASSPSENDLLFVAKLVPSGRFSRYCMEKISVGSTLTMKGPFGFFILDPLPGAHIIFAGTGTGLAPFRGQLISALESGDNRTIDLLFCVRERSDLFWMNEIAALRSKHQNLHIHVSLSQGPADWQGLRGRVQEHLPKMIKNPEQTLLYACGNPEMTKDVRKRAIEEWMIPKKQVHVEGYI